MIRVNYTGRLGNNLFQYALGRYLAEEMGYELSADPLPFPRTHERVSGHSFQGPHESVGPWEANILGIISNPSIRSLIIQGNFQYYSYYKPFMDRIQKWFAFPQDLSSPWEINANDLLIYLRLGDYYDVGFTLKFEFYELAIKMAMPTRIFIVTEDKNHPFVRIFDRYNPIIVSQDPLADLAMARFFKKIVLSASSFSWWAAILSDADEVYFPIGDDGHWSLHRMQSPNYHIDLRVDEPRFIYFYNCAVLSSNRQNTNLVPLSEATPLHQEEERFNQSALRFHKKSKAFWFESKIPISTVLTRTDIINILIDQKKYRSYLEIGFGEGGNFNAIDIPFGTKISVDPISDAATHKISSDLFFEINNKTYDLIFIDGLHYAYQVYRDIFNSLKVLNPGGMIVCHDMNPSTFEEQVVPMHHGMWTGDCWKAWVRLKMERSDLDMKVIDADHGCGIIQRGEQPLLPYIVELTWDGLVANRKEWLKLISTEEFLESTNIHI